MTNTTTRTTYLPPEPWVEGFILQRVEGRSDDPAWPYGEMMVRESLRSFDYRLRLAASKMEHEGYDKFDLTVIYSDGNQARMRLDLDRDFTSLREHFPYLYR